jgi:hypothetical protein
LDTSNEQAHDLRAMLYEAGPMSDSIQSIMQASSTAWSIGFEDGTLVLAEWLAGPARVTLSASIGAPQSRRRATVHSVALSYNMLWRETGGVRIGQAGDEETMLLMQDVYGGESSSEQFARAIEHFSRLAAWWGAYVEADEPVETVEPRDFMTAMASRV